MHGSQVGNCVERVRVLRSKFSSQRVIAPTGETCGREPPCLCVCLFVCVFFFFGGGRLVVFCLGVCVLSERILSNSLHDFLIFFVNLSDT